MEGTLAGARVKASLAALLAVLVALAMLPAATVGAPAARAHADICTSMLAGNVDIWQTGAVRTSGNHRHDIGWSTSRQRCSSPTGFPAGGDLTNRVQLLQKNADGSCSNTVVVNGSTIRYTQAGQIGYSVTNVLATSCYRFRWKANNNISANTRHGEAIIRRDA